LPRPDLIVPEIESIRDVAANELKLKTAHFAYPITSIDHVELGMFLSLHSKTFS